MGSRIHKLVRDLLFDTTPTRSDSDENPEKERKGARTLGANVLANLLAAVVVSASLLIWHLLTTRNDWTWRTLPRFAFSIHPVIWTFVAPVAIAVIATVAPKYRIFENGPVLNRVIDSMLVWPAFFAFIVWSGLHPGTFPLIPLPGNGFFQHLETSFARPLEQEQRFTSVYVLLFPFGLVTALLAQAIRWNRILVRVPNREDATVNPKINLRPRQNPNQAPNLLGENVFKDAIREDSSKGKTERVPLIDASNRSNQDPADAAFKKTRGAVITLAREIGTGFKNSPLAEPPPGTYEPSRKLRAAREIELAAHRIARGFIEDNLIARIDEFLAANELIDQAASDVAEKTEAVALVKARGAVLTLVNKAGAELNRYYITPGMLPGRSFTGMIWEPEPHMGLPAAQEIEFAARSIASGYIRDIREMGLSWAMIGAALKRLPRSVNRAGKVESIAEAAYNYAVGESPPEFASDDRSFAWTCPVCSASISDRMPSSYPGDDEQGHADGCPRLVASIAEWRADRGD